MQHVLLPGEGDVTGFSKEVGICSLDNSIISMPRSSLRKLTGDVKILILRSIEGTEGMMSTAYSSVVSVQIAQVGRQRQEEEQMW